MNPLYYNNADIRKVYQTYSIYIDQRTRAELEEEMWNLVPPALRGELKNRKFNRENWLLQLLGEKAEHVTAITTRNALRHIGSPDADPFWKLLDDSSVSMGTVRHMISIAKKISNEKDVLLNAAIDTVIKAYHHSKEHNISIDDAIKALFIASDDTINLTKKKSKKKSKSSKPRTLWDDIREQNKEAMDVLLAGVSENVAALIRKDFNNDITALFALYQNRIQRFKGQKGISIEAIPRKSFLEACRTLKITTKIPKTGVEPDDSFKNAVKRQYRACAAQYHPDRNPGDDSATELFREVQEAFNTIQNYCDGFQDKE